MTLAEFNYPLKSYELPAYELSTKFIKKGYATDVYQEGRGYVTLVYKKHQLNKLIGTPSVVKINFRPTPRGSEVEITVNKVKLKGKEIVKESLMIITILPGIGKLIESQKIKNEVKKEIPALIFKYKKEIK